MGSAYLSLLIRDAISFICRNVLQIKESIWKERKQVCCDGCRMA